VNTTLGIDLASQPKHTALCAIAWDDGRAEVRALAHASWNGTALHDKLLSTAIRGLWGIDGGWGDAGHPVKTAIDAPFGWPEPFVQALEACSCASRRISCHSRSPPIASPIARCAAP
jgi:Protein of unknown function (DUF429)